VSTLVIYLRPLVLVLALVYPFGDTLERSIVLGAVGAYVGYWAIYLEDVVHRTIRFHEGVVCLSGRHVSWTFMLLLGIPHALAGVCAAVVAHETPNYWNAFFAAIVYLVFGFTFSILWRISTASLWKEDWERFIEVAVGDEEQESGSDVVREINQHIDMLLRTGGGASNVREFELLVMQALMFRGFAIGLHDASAIEEVFEDLVFDDEDERREWLERDLDEQAWKDVGPAYSNFIHQVRNKQREQLHGQVQVHSD
jgi:hypothetical protein